MNIDEMAFSLLCDFAMMASPPRVSSFFLKEKSEESSLSPKPTLPKVKNDDYSLVLCVLYVRVINDGRWSKFNNAS